MFLSESPREREDELRRQQQDEGLDPWGYPEDEPQDTQVRVGEGTEST